MSSGKDTIDVNKGSCVTMKLIWKDEGGPMNLTGKSLEVLEQHPGPLDLEVSITDAASGEGTIKVGEGSSQRVGKSAWFTLGLLDGGECVRSTPPIWINVK